MFQQLYFFIFSFLSINCFDYSLSFYIIDFIIDYISCVRWNPNGDMLASASDDGTAKLIDFNTGKVIHTGNTVDGSKLLNLFYSQNPLC